MHLFLFWFSAVFCCLLALFCFCNYHYCTGLFYSPHLVGFHCLFFFLFSIFKVSFCTRDLYPCWVKSKTSVFATDGIWQTFSVVLNFLLIGWTPLVGFQNERLMCFHDRQKRNGHSRMCCYSNTICKCDGRNRLFHFFPSVAF